MSGFCSFFCILSGRHIKLRNLFSSISSQGFELHLSVQWTKKNEKQTVQHSSKILENCFRSILLRTFSLLWFWSSLSRPSLANVILIRFLKTITYEPLLWIALAWRGYLRRFSTKLKYIFTNESLFCSNRFGVGVNLIIALSNLFRHHVVSSLLRDARHTLSEYRFNVHTARAQEMHDKFIF